jgi:predicted permease
MGTMSGLLSSLPGDFRVALRSLARDPGYSVTAGLTFALCLGANLALFAVVNAILLRPLPFPDADRLVTVYNNYPKAGADHSSISVPHYLERRAGVAAFAESAAWRGGGETIGDAGSPDRVDAMRVTPSFFRVLGVAAALGRTFTDEEGEEGRSHVVLLSDGLWRRKFGADPQIVGRQVRLGGGATRTVVGVLPRDFRFLSSRAQLWTPLTFTADDRKPERRHSNNQSMIARLRAGVSLATTQAQVDALNRSTLAADPYAKLVVDAGFHTTVAGLQADHVAELKPVLLILQAGVLLLLLIGVVNLANLSLVRASGRWKEISVRQVLGAGRARIARQIATEMLVLTLGGGLLGLGVGWAGLRAIAALGGDRLLPNVDLRLDATVCLAALAGAVLVGLMLALPVVWHGLHGNLAAALSVESRGGTTSRATHRLRHALIVAQFALAFVLLTGAGLLGRSFVRLLAVQPGFAPAQVLTGTIPLPRAQYGELKVRLPVIERLTRELRALPGVTAVSVSSNIPFSGDGSNNATTVVGHEPKPGESLQTHWTSGVTGDYFTVFGIPLRAGRLLTADDTARGERVCVIDESVARRYWGTASPLGGQLFNGTGRPGEKPYTIVGVVGAIKHNDLADQRAQGEIYYPYAEFPSLMLRVGLRTSLPPAALGPSLRAAVLRIDPDLPVIDLKPMAERIDDSLAVRRGPMWLAVLFAAAALGLAGLGLYGVLAYAVAQRRREIGVRMALGAQPEQIRAQFLALGARLALAGALLGAVGAWFAGRAMEGLLFGVRPTDPVVAGLVLAVLAAIALGACLTPAVRAARVPPMEALRDG